MEIDADAKNTASHVALHGALQVLNVDEHRVALARCCQGGCSSIDRINEQHSGGLRAAVFASFETTSTLDSTVAAVTAVVAAIAAVITVTAIAAVATSEAVLVSAFQGEVTY